MFLGITLGEWALIVGLGISGILLFFIGIGTGYKMEPFITRVRHRMRSQHATNDITNTVTLHPTNQNHYMSSRSLDELRIRSNVEVFNRGGEVGTPGGSTNVDLDNGGNRVYNRIDHSRRSRMELPGEELRVEFSNVGGDNVNGREPEVRIRRPSIDRLSSESMNHVERGSPTNVQTIDNFNRGRSIKR